MPFIGKMSPCIFLRADEYVSTYHDLDTIEDAGERLFKDSPRTEDPLAVRDLLRMLRDHNVTDTVGVWLQHRHWNVDKSSVMLHTSNDGMDVAKAMQPDHDKRLYPTNVRLINTGDGYTVIPLEFTYSSSPGEDFLNALDNEDFINKVGAYLEALGLLDVLGLASVSSSDLDVQDDFTWVEHNDVETCSSKVFLEQHVDLHKQTDKYDVTLWTDPGGRQRGCLRIQYCRKGRRGVHHSIMYHRRK